MPFKRGKRGFVHPFRKQDVGSTGQATQGRSLTVGCCLRISPVFLEGAVTKKWTVTEPATRLRRRTQDQGRAPFGVPPAPGMFCSGGFGTPPTPGLGTVERFPGEPYCMDQPRTTARAVPPFLQAVTH